MQSRVYGDNGLYAWRMQEVGLCCYENKNESENENQNEMKMGMKIKMKMKMK